MKNSKRAEEENNSIIFFFCHAHMRAKRSELKSNDMNIIKFKVITRFNK